MVHLALRLQGLHSYQRSHQRWLVGETGLTENGTVLFLIVAVVAGVWTVVRCARARSLRLGWWVALLTAGCFYFCGEELSWGQHYAQWSTPEAWREINDQQETNLHNCGFLFDQAPRAALTCGIFVGGILVPLKNWRRGQRRDPVTDVSYWLWPTAICVPTAVLATFCSVPDTLCKSLGWRSPLHLGGEAKEYFMALFLMLYLVSLCVRLRLPAERAQIAQAPLRALSNGIRIQEYGNLLLPPSIGTAVSRLSNRRLGLRQRRFLRREPVAELCHTDSKA
jgi:hypothetical protein